MSARDYSSSCALAASLLKPYRTAAPGNDGSERNYLLHLGQLAQLARAPH